MESDQFDDYVRREVNDADKTHPSEMRGVDAMWTKIQHRRQQRKKNATIIRWVAAASIAGVLTAGFYLQNRFATSHHDDARSTGRFLSNEEKHAFDLINQACTNNHISCNTPEFRELREDLARSFVRLEEIEKQQSVYGDDESLLRARKRVEGHQAHLLKIMVKKI